MSSLIDAKNNQSTVEISFEEILGYFLIGLVSIVFFLYKRSDYAFLFFEQQTLKSPFWNFFFLVRRFYTIVFRRDV